MSRYATPQSPRLPSHRRPSSAAVTVWILRPVASLKLVRSCPSGLTLSTRPTGPGVTMLCSGFGSQASSARRALYLYVCVDVEGYKGKKEQSLLCVEGAHAQGQRCLEGWMWRRVEREQHNPLHGRHACTRTSSQRAAKAQKKRKEERERKALGGFPEHSTARTPT